MHLSHTLSLHLIMFIHLMFQNFNLTFCRLQHFSKNTQTYLWSLLTFYLILQEQPPSTLLHHIETQCSVIGALLCPLCGKCMLTRFIPFSASQPCVNFLCFIFHINISLLLKLISGTCALLPERKDHGFLC